MDETPSLEVQVLNKHTDQVLHVSFSHDGNRFATSAKDGHIMVSVTLAMFVLNFMMYNTDYSVRNMN